MVSIASGGPRGETAARPEEVAEKNPPPALKSEMLEFEKISIQNNWKSFFLFKTSSSATSALPLEMEIAEFSRYLVASKSRSLIEDKILVSSHWIPVGSIVYLKRERKRKN